MKEGGGKAIAIGAVLFLYLINMMGHPDECQLAEYPYCSEDRDGIIALPNCIQ